MPRVKLNLKGLSALEKIAKARQIVTALTGNASFPTPTPPLTKVTAAADALETAYADTQTARQIAQTKTSIQHDKEDELETLLRQLASYIDSASGDDESAILSTGLDVRGAASATVPTAPTALTASDGDMEGEIDLHWDSVKGARSYIIERSEDPNKAASWAHATVAAKSSATVNGLTSGTRYWFRVAAVFSSGQSGWSDPSAKIAP